MQATLHALSGRLTSFRFLLLLPLHHTPGSCIDAVVATDQKESQTRPVTVVSALGGRPSTRQDTPTDQKCRHCYFRHQVPSKAPNQLPERRQTETIGSCIRNATMITVLPHFLITAYSVNFIADRQPMGKLTNPHGVSENER